MDCSYMNPRPAAPCCPQMITPTPANRNCGCGMLPQPRQMMPPMPSMPPMPPMPSMPPMQPMPIRNQDCPDTSIGGMERYPVGMGYIPWQQWQQTYSLEKGLNRGTIFPDLDLPFMMGRCR